jgi:hypothetical protein
MACADVASDKAKPAAAIHLIMVSLLWSSESQTPHSTPMVHLSLEVDQALYDGGISATIVRAQIALKCANADLTDGRKAMLRLVVLACALTLASVAQAFTPVPLQKPSDMVIQARAEPACTA